jgi:hypothetical protein
MVAIDRDWLTLNVAVIGSVPVGSRLQLSGPSPDGEPILPLKSDPRVRDEAIDVGVARFYPTVPGWHHFRMVDAAGGVSQPLARIKLEADLNQTVTLDLQAVRHVPVRVSGLAEVLQFLGRKFVNTAYGRTVAEDGITWVWIQDAADEVRLNCIDLEVPSGIPIVIRSRTDKLWELELAPDISFVTVEAQPRHGGAIRFAKPGTATSLRTLGNHARFVGRQRALEPYVVWETVGDTRYLIGVLEHAPASRYETLRVDTSGRWVSVTCASAWPAFVSLYGSFGRQRELIATIGSNRPTQVWIPTCVQSVTAVNGTHEAVVAIGAADSYLSIQL